MDSVHKIELINAIQKASNIIQDNLIRGKASFLVLTKSIFRFKYLRLFLENFYSKVFKRSKISD